MQKITATGVLCMVVWASALAGGKPAVLTDKVELIVGNKAYTSQELDEIQSFRSKVAFKSKQSTTDRQTFLKDYASERIQLGYAQRVGLGLSEEETVQMEAELLQQYEVGSRAQLEQKLLAKKINTELFFDYAKEAWILDKIQSVILRPRVQLKDDETEQLKQDIAKEHPEFLVEDYVVRVQNAKMKPAALARDLKKLAKKLQAVSTDKPIKDKRIQNRSLLDWKTEDELPDVFKASIKKMQPGQVSDPIKAPNGWHVLKLIEKRPLQHFPEGDQLTAMLFEKKMVHEYAKWKAMLEEQEYVELLGRS